MAAARLNIYESWPLLHKPSGARPFAQATLFMQGVEIPGSISFNNLVILRSQGHTSASATVSFGLYSLNAATLSLANSASVELNSNANGLSWRTMSTSANQDITPGNWYFAYLTSSSGNNSQSLFVNPGLGAAGSSHGGIFARGFMSVSTAGLPVAICTTDMVKEGMTSGNNQYPYIIISA